MHNPLLPHLEVQSFDAIGIDERKQDCETYQNCSNWSLEVGIISKMFLNVDFDHRFEGHSGHFNGVFHIPILAYDQSVYCPRHRANPVIPYPPFWDFLKFFKGKRIQNFAYVEDIIFESVLSKSNLLVWGWRNLRIYWKVKKKQLQILLPLGGLVWGKQPSFRSTWSREMRQRSRRRTRRI